MMKQVIASPVWKKLIQQAQNLDIASQAQEAIDAQNMYYKKSVGGIIFDYSRQRISPPVLELLIQLAHETGLPERIEALLTGQKVNVSENKAALHTALRSSSPEPLWSDGINIMTQVLNTREQIKHIADTIRNGLWTGFSGLPITDIVNVGMGGSDLGPRLCIHALHHYSADDLKYHFISDADPDSFKQVIRQINPQTALFIISSKSFKTKETLLNASKALKLYTETSAIDKHFIAVTASPSRALQMGIKTVLPIWDWVGGRYSLCSAVNLITAIAIGYDQFSELLAGANTIDRHLRQTDFKDNIPVLMGLLGIWNNNFLNIHNLLLLVYSSRLEYFIPYVQQLDMESNGKSIDMQGQLVNYATGPIIWGGLGNQAQHSYLQLLCQGTHQCAADFVTLQSNNDHILNSLCDYKMKVLSDGIQSVENPHACIPGKMPLNHISLVDCSPHTLGALVALYEHKVFVQSVIWNINPFDQPGVESAKSSAAFLDSAYREGNHSI